MVIKMDKKRVTIFDVAKNAGVSIATVSRVLNETNYPVNDELRKTVLETAELMNYKPNYFGKSLKSGKSSEIGVILPSMINPFYSEVIAGIEKECRRAGYNPIFCSSGNRPGKEQDLIGLMQEKCVEGLLLSTVSATSGTLADIDAGGCSVVLFDQPVSGFEGDTVTFDFYQAGILSAQYLAQKGHRELAFLSAPFDRFSRRAIFSGFQDALADAGVPFRMKNLIVSRVEDTGKSGSAEFENGRSLAQSFLNSRCPATAIAAVNDITAFGIVQELARNSCRIPEDISVMGFDNIDFSAMLSPALTTVSQPSIEMGMLATQVLIKRIRDKDRAAEHILLKPEIVERESVRAMLP
jgi:LacI family transcriptional regulator